MQEQKRNIIDESKLNKIISDSQSRRNRQQRQDSQPQNKHKPARDPRSTSKLLQMTQSQEVLPQSDQHIHVDLQSEKSTHTLNSNQSRRQAPGPYSQQQYGDDKNFNSTISSNKHKVKNPSSSKKQAVNYIERNKRDLEQLKAKAQLQSRPTTILANDNNEGQMTMTNKNVQSKVNTGLNRSKSAMGRVRKQKTLQEKAYRLDMSPDERLQDDLRRKITNEAKVEIKGQVDNKYADLERMLQSNMGNRSDIIQKEQPYKCESKIDQEPIDIQFQTMSSYYVQQQKRPQTSTQTIVRKKSQPPISRVFEPNSTQSVVKTPKAANAKITTAKNGNFAGNQVMIDKSLDVQKRVQTKKSIKDMSSFTPNKQSAISLPKSQTPSSHKKPALVPRLNLNSDTKSPSAKTSVKPMNNKDKVRGMIECNVEESVILNSSPIHMQEVPADDELDLKSSGTRSQVDYKLQTKDDYLNFSIEKIWKEMEEIGRSKKAAQDLFQAFQNQYYDREASQYYNQGECSPTKRLISMKNAVTKHKNIEHKSGIKDGQYSLQYTTCPEKSYVVKPEDGRINYDEFKDKHAHKFVEKIINAQVERIEFIEDNQRSSSPIRKSITSKSPVKIIKEQCKRGTLVRNSVSVRLEDNFTEGVEQQEKSIIEQSVDEDPEIQINLDTEEYMESDDGYIVSNTHNKNGRKLLVEGRK